MSQISTGGFWPYREEEEGAVEIEQLPALGCQGSTQITPDIFVALTKLITEVKLTLIQLQKVKGETALLRFEKYVLIKLITGGQ